MHEIIEKHLMEPGPRFKFVTHRVGDEALVSVTGTTRETLLRKVLSCHADTNEAQGNADALKRRFANKT